MLVACYNFTNNQIWIQLYLIMFLKKMVQFSCSNDKFEKN